jgi:hypothetical protein
VRLPVGKILWGMFAFPVLYPGAFLAAAGLPLLGLIAVSLTWASGAISSDQRAALWIVLVINFVLFAWLAVRCHRMVLVENGTADAPIVGLVFRYLAALTTGTVLKNIFLLVMMMVFLTIVANSRTAGEPVAPTADPAVQRMIDYGRYVLQIPALYLLARCSTLLPAIALGSDWNPGAAWRQTRGNGWRLVLVVFFLPWVFTAAVDWAYEVTWTTWIVGILAALRSVLLALGVIALSLSYRELPPWPAPPPTPPPS